MSATGKQSDLSLDRSFKSLLNKFKKWPNCLNKRGQQVSGQAHVLAALLEILKIKLPVIAPKTSKKLILGSRSDFWLSVIGLSTISMRQETLVARQWRNSFSSIVRFSTRTSMTQISSQMTSHRSSRKFLNTPKKILTWLWLREGQGSALEIQLLKPSYPCFSKGLIL